MNSGTDNPENFMAEAIVKSVEPLMLAEALREIHALRARRDELLEANNRYQQDARDSRITKGETEIMVLALNRFNRDLQKALVEMRTEHDAVLGELAATGHDHSQSEKLHILVDRAIDKERTRFESALRLIIGLPDEDMAGVFSQFRTYEKVAEAIAAAVRENGGIEKLFERQNSAEPEATDGEAKEDNRG